MFRRLAIGLHNGSQGTGASVAKRHKHAGNYIRVTQYILVKICTLQYGRLRLLS